MTKVFNILLILFFSKSILCKEKNESINTISHSDVEKLSLPDINRISRGIIKRPEKPRVSNDRKRVTFADQVLDDTVGAEPLDTKITAKNRKNGGAQKLSAQDDGKFKSNSSNTIVPYMSFLGLLPLLFMFFYLH